MKIKLLTAFLLCSTFASAQSSGNKAVSASQNFPVYVMLAPAGADTGLEIRSAMRISVVHMEEGALTGYRFKDQAFLMSCRDEKSADAMMSKLRSRYQDAKVEKLHLKSYINEGFLEVKKNAGRADPTFPIEYETGDARLDSRSYRIEKLEWINSHPAPQDGSLPGTIKNK